MKAAEAVRGPQVLEQIDAQSGLIELLAEQKGVDANLVKAIVYEEQTHNKTPGFLEDALPVKSVGPMAVNEKWWDGATKEEMQDPILNYAVGIDLVKKSEEVVSAANDSPSIAQIASNYNNENAVTVVTDYGERVEGFYQWFKSRDE